MKETLIIMISIPCAIIGAIIGTYIGLWLANNFSFHKIIKFIKREKPKNLF